MFLSKIKKVYHKLSIKNGSLENQSHEKNSKIKSIAFLIDINKLDSNDLDELINFFNKNFNDFFNKNIFLYKSIPSKNNISNLTTFTLKDFSIIGTAKSLSLKQFIDTNFDLLINFFSYNDVSLHSIALQSNAKFKVGFKSQIDYYNDIIFKIGIEESEIFFQELKKYLKILQKIE